MLTALATLLLAPAAALLTWDDLTTRPKPRADATIAYGSDQMQKVDVWLPKGKGPFPVVVMVHGGCWTTGIADRSLMNWVADDLRKDGIAVWNIDYRGVDRTGGGYPGTFADAGKAADQLAVNARKYHLDTRKVVAIGHSAGGHLALWLAARPRIAPTSPLRVAYPLRIAHVISLGGLPDLEATAASPDNGCGTDVVAALVGKPAPGRTDVYADTSVPRLLPLKIPQELVNGHEDTIIPFRMATDYGSKARAAGDTATLHTVPATGHVELVAPETPAWAEAKRLIRDAFK
ncbi:alpha/beta hydrolase [Sphingomonas ginsenosidivorax]|uniref:Alpha/beta hydrolase n=1 Tax=Sphingomonas ginsenosidivorax TaxID=862135 RepID=A0A5C6UF73_9SPHN|nr:alpha/beta hydrolase [Sphingomonas ginsenosidivorax]TXC70705.1 alpha/beta hydrolase [Sphingomonas ginsenosidivorax]